MLNNRKDDMLFWHIIFFLCLVILDVLTFKIELTNKFKSLLGTLIS